MDLKSQWDSYSYAIILEEEVTFLGTTYKPGDMLFVQSFDSMPVFGTSGAKLDIRPYYYASPLIATGYIYGGFENDIYTVTDSAGNVTSSAPWFENRDLVKRVYFLGPFKPKSTAGWFAGFSNLRIVKTTGNEHFNRLDTSSVTDMTSMFDGCSKLQAVNYTDDWETDNVESMTAMFANCSSLDELLVNFWDVSNVRKMDYMFYNCSRLDFISSLNDLNVENVTDMSHMFSGCSSYEHISFSNWDTSNVEDMSGMFEGCSSLRHVEIGPNFRFDGNGISDDAKKATLPAPSGERYSGKWVGRDENGIVRGADGKALALTSEELVNWANSDNAGTWHWQVKNSQVFCKRLAGADRYGTMAEVNKAGWPDGSASTILLATGDNYPDALSAGSLAGLLNAPPGHHFRKIDFPQRTLGDRQDEGI
ncbi:MAG: BspA family leucine-rich repeat surface protein [Coriobacteriales bacterium]